MKCHKILLMGAAFSLALASCVSEDIPSDISEKGMGSMSLDVDQLKPTSTRGNVSTADFPVTVYTSDNKAFEYNGVKYEGIKASEFPNKITMPVGTYYAEAHTPGQLAKIMTTPYYKGRKEFEILQGVNTKTTVTCRMANGSFKVNYSSDFATKFSEWNVFINDGTESVIQFSDKDGLTPQMIYMTFEDNVDVLNVEFKGTTTTGNTIATSNKLTKKAASEKYDDDNENFSGGDAIVINFSPTESLEGDITGITLTANIKFEEREEYFEMEVEDKEISGGSGEAPGEGENGSDNDAITLNLPAPITFTSGEGENLDPSLGDTYLAAADGMKSITVSIVSTSPDMNDMLPLLGDQYGVDLISGTEVIGNQGLKDLFASVGQELDVPNEGDKEYTFPIGNFFSLLDILPGVHTFYLTVTDMNGNSKSGNVQITITED